MVMASCFAFLPHVCVQFGDEVQVGPFILWRNSPAEWTRRFGVDNSAFFEVYRDRLGNPVGEKASILSKPDYTEASYEAFRDAVYCLSAAKWARSHGASDAWVFERWFVDVPTPLDEVYRRSSKFSDTITSARYDHVYPTPYTHRIDINSYHDQDTIERFAREMAKPRQESMLTAFSHFHLARFDTPYFTSPGDAIESMWSGFESLLEIDKFGAVPSLEVSEKREHVGKDEKLLRALRDELGRCDADWSQDFWNGVTAWVTQFYKERNHHSHGVRGDLAVEMLEPYGLSSFSAAIHVARAVLRLRSFGKSGIVADFTAEELNSVFAFVPLIERTSNVLRQYDRKVWYPGGGSHGSQLTAESLDGFARDLSHLVSLRSESQHFRSNGHVAQARHKMGLVLSPWVDDLIKQSPPNVELGAVSAIPSTIKELAEEGRPNEEIDTALAEALFGWGASDVESYGSGAMAEPRLLLRGKIPIWVWIDAYIKLSEVWTGYPLR